MASRTPSCTAEPAPLSLSPLTTLLSQSVLSALTNQVPAKADIKATLSMYKYLDNVRG
jgi:hypothetical protein